ncbi:MAG: cupin domain-containing protein [Burkholderiales bacterium]|nr:cupin domain-containing protein [Burkholderiales bacterium]
MPSAEQPVLPDRLVAELLAASTSTDDLQARAAQRRARQQLMRRIATETGAATHTVRMADAAWQPCLRGVERMVVNESGPVHTWLLRLAPGASLPAHAHDHGDEESFILSGSCLLDGEPLGAGDYHHAPAGSRHDRLVSETGCMLWLRLPAEQARAMMPAAAR